MLCTLLVEKLSPYKCDATQLPLLQPRFAGTLWKEQLSFIQSAFPVHQGQNVYNKDDGEDCNDDGDNVSNGKDMKYDVV